MSGGTRLDGKVCVVTGAGGGLGSAIADVFASEGAAVVVNDVHASSADVTVGLCHRRGAEAWSAVADVSDRGAVDAMFATIADRYGRLDVLVNNAGIGSDYSTPPDADGVRRASITAVTDDMWHRMLAVHLDGTFFCTRAAVALMAPRARGSIVSVSSIAALTGFGSAYYSAAKGGILGFTRALARELGPFGIRVNAVCPGVIDAGITHDAGPGAADGIVPTIPLRRLGEAVDVAYAALYLASDESAYTTGQWLSPNGGLFIA